MDGEEGGEEGHGRTVRVCGEEGHGRTVRRVCGEEGHRWTVRRVVRRDMGGR